MIKSTKNCIILLLFLFISFVGFSQGPPPPTPPPPPGLPIDGGILALLGIGFIFGIRKLIKSNKN